MTKIIRFFPIILVILFAGCSHEPVEVDDGLLNDPSGIPDRPGIIEEKTGQKLEKSW